MENKWKLKGSVGHYYFEDEHGNKSEEYYEANKYKDGYALILKDKWGKYNYRDTNGNLSEDYYAAYNYSGGAAMVQKTKFSPFVYRDIFGNLHNRRKNAETASKNGAIINITIEDYFKNKVSAYSLSPSDIYNHLDDIIAWEKYKLKLKMENSEDDKRNELFEEASDIAEYIKHTAYDYGEKLKKDKKEIEEYTERLF